jgi:hypothetical protein
MHKLTFKAPYKVGQTIMLKSGRVQDRVVGFSGKLMPNGEVKHLNVVTEKYDRGYLVEHIKTEPTWNDAIILSKYKIGDEIIFHDDNNYRMFLLKRDKVSAIDFNTGSFGKLIYYYVESKATSISLREIYTSKEDFANRTRPKVSAKKGEKYVFINYCIQQKKLEPVKVEKLTATHSTYQQGWGEKIKTRSCYLYNSHKSFVNKMTAQI